MRLDRGNCALAAKQDSCTSMNACRQVTRAPEQHNASESGTREGKREPATLGHRGRAPRPGPPTRREQENKQKDAKRSSNGDRKRTDVLETRKETRDVPLGCCDSCGVVACASPPPAAAVPPVPKKTLWKRFCALDPGPCSGHELRCCGPAPGGGGGGCGDRSRAVLCWWVRV